MHDLESLRNFAREFAKTLTAPTCVALHGDLGAGKTEFARAVIQGIKGPYVIVPSPTFTIVQEYPPSIDGQGAATPGISHFDLYRIKSENELYEIGFFDAIAKDIALIEWPENAAGFIPKNAINVYITIADGGRDIRVTDS